MPKRSSAPPSSPSSPSLEAIDALFALGDLTRSRHGKSLQLRREARREPAAPEELMRPVAKPAIAANGVQWLPVSGSRPQQRRPVAGDPGWKQFWAGFSTRLGGVSRAYCTEDAPGELNLGFTPADDREAVLRNRRLLVEAVTGSADTPLITVHQFHSNLVIRASATDAHSERPHRPGVPSDRSSSPGRKADGLITDQPGLLLAVMVADCIPVLVADRKRRVVAAFHAGWRGTVKRIVETGIGRMRLEFGSRPEDLVAAIGPGAGPCCYAVGEEVISEFESQFIYARQLFHEVYSSDPVRNRYPMLFLTQRAPGHSDIGPQTHLDLVEANRRQLLDAGLRDRAIKIVGGCTSCHPELFYSHRASRGHAGRMMAVIGIRA
jgi:polyphenol oxidase